MKHRTQLYLDEDQHRWLKRQAGRDRSIAAVVRELIDEARNRGPSPGEDPLIRYLAEDPPAEGVQATTVATLDDELYGADRTRD